MSSPQQSSIAERIALGKEQNSTDGGAIVPFPADSDFNNPFTMLPSYGRSWVAGKQNDGYRLTSFVYRSEDALPIFCVLRVDHPELGKDIRPLRCERVIGIKGDAAMRHLEGTRPLYNLDQLAKRPDDPVLLVEGERTANAAEARFGTHVATTWPGGAQSVGSIELLPLVGRNVTIWPDNDREGIKAAEWLAGELLRIGAASCRIVNVPDTFPSKWDLADDVLSDIGSEGIQALLDSATLASPAHVTSVAASKPHLAPKAVISASLKRDESMLRFLIDNGHLDLGGRGDWIKVGIATKASQGEAGFELWDRLSSEAPGYDETKIRKEWDTFKDRADGEPRLTLATFAKLARDAGWSDQGTSTRTTDGGSAYGGAATKTDQAVKVLELVDEAGDERFLDLDGQPYVRFRQVRDASEHWVNCKIDSDTYRRSLARRFYLDKLKVLSPEQLKSAVALLQAEAIECDERHPVFLRRGMHNGKLYVDLGRSDGAAVEVTVDGWTVINEAPVRFVRGSRGALPVPELGGKLSVLEKHMPGLNRPDVQRVMAFLIGSFNPEGTYPLLLFSGGQGTLKSSMGDITIALSDPPSQRRDARFSFSSKEQDLLIHAKNAQVLFFDNVSSFGQKESDTLCRLLSGAAFSTRQLYTMDEEHRIALCRPVIATSIETPSRRGDLLSRMLTVITRRVEHRCREEDAWQAFEADKAKLFGLVLSGISTSLRNKQAVGELIASGALRLPRLADFAAFVEGAAEILELETGEFCEMLDIEQSSLQAEAASGDPLGAALIRYFSYSDVRKINCTAAELLDRISDGNNDRKRNWPSVNKVRGHLDRICPGLRDLGLEVTFTKPQGKRNVWLMEITATDAFCPSNITDRQI